MAVFLTLYEVSIHIKHYMHLHSTIILARPRIKTPTSGDIQYVI